jgi:hypothetical protein
MYPWHEEKFQQRALAALEESVEAIRRHRRQYALDAWSRVMAAVQADQISFARHIARHEKVSLAPLGTGSLLGRPILYREPRTSWRIYPLDARHGIRLPEKAKKVKAAWEMVGSPFNAFCLADEVPSGEAVLTRMASHKVGRAAAVVAMAGGKAALSLATALVAPLGAIASLAMLDPILIGVISTDGLTGDWFALERWNH